LHLFNIVGHWLLHVFAVLNYYVWKQLIMRQTKNSARNNNKASGQMAHYGNRAVDSQK